MWTPALRLNSCTYRCLRHFNLLIGSIPIERAEARSGRKIIFRTKYYLTFWILSSKRKVKIDLKLQNGKWQPRGLFSSARKIQNASRSRSQNWFSVIRSYVVIGESGAYLFELHLYLPENKMHMLFSIKIHLSIYISIYNLKIN